MNTRTINIQLIEQTQKRRIVTFTPKRLTAADDDVLLRQVYVVRVDANGEATIALPVRESGTITYQYEIPAVNGKSKGEFNLEAGSPIDLADLIEGSPEASDSIQQYIDGKIAEIARPYKVFSALVHKADNGALGIEQVKENTIGDYETGTFFDEQNGVYIPWITFDDFTNLDPGRVWCSHPVTSDPFDSVLLVYGHPNAEYVTVVVGDVEIDGIVFFGKTPGSQFNPAGFPIEIRVYDE